MKRGKEKSELEGRKYWKEKAERLQRENIELRNRLDAYELALNIWSKGQSELLMGKNYEQQFENGMPKYKSDLYFNYLQMEKLIELYYEHKLDLLKREMRVNGATEKEIEMADIEKVEEEELEENLNKLSELKPFIKRLVENNKIDRDETIINSDFMPVAFDRKGEKYEWNEEKQLLMLLSIQDEPINFLISILK